MDEDAGRDVLMLAETLRRSSLSSSPKRPSTSRRMWSRSSSQWACTSLDPCILDERPRARASSERSTIESEARAAAEREDWVDREELRRRALDISRACTLRSRRESSSWSAEREER